MTETRYRFTLATLFLAVTMCCLAAGLWLAWPKWPAVGLAALCISFIGGLFLSTLGGSVFGELAIVIGAVISPIPFLSPAWTTLTISIFYGIPVVASAWYGDWVGRRLAPPSDAAKTSP
jgi:hypothetical protein